MLSAWGASLAPACASYLIAASMSREEHWIPSTADHPADDDDNEGDDPLLLHLVFRRLAARRLQAETTKPQIT